MARILQLAALSTFIFILCFLWLHTRRASAISSNIESRPALSAERIRKLRMDLESAWHVTLPPAGTPCSVPWDGLSAEGLPAHMDVLDCFESVSLLTDGDSGNFAYRTWPTTPLTDVDKPSAWNDLQSNLRRGDVVEFVAHIRHLNGTVWTTNFHAQVCVEDGGMMFGANNEPRFIVVRGIPTETMRWDFCTSHDYYLALKNMDSAWRACGEDHTYSVQVYRRP